MTPSLKPTRTGRPAWPGQGVFHRPSCGRAGLPVRVAQIERWAA
jgi:hypothetical protein